MPAFDKFQDSQALLEELGRLKKQIFTLRLRHVAGMLEDTSSLRSARRDVARLLTHLNARRNHTKE